MKRKTNKAKEEAWSQTAHAPDEEQSGPEASDTSGQSVPKSKFRKKSQQEQAAAAKLRMESQGEKLEQAREKLAKQKPPKKPGPVKRIGRVASGSVHSFVHGKIFEVEQENVGTEGAHRSELAGETALRHGSRFVRRKVREHPAKVVRKAEARYTKYTADYHFHTAAQEHPELTKNALTGYWQKQRLRRQYRKQAKEAAKQGAAAAGKTATATERLTARAVEFVKSHPAGAVVAVLCVLLLFAMQSCSSTMLMLGNAGAGALGASTYPCEDRDMLAAEAAYCALEDDLQHYLDTYESTHDYDEYHFDLDEIEHDPYVLLSLLCALHEGQWTIDEVQGTLQMLFDRQYILTEDVVVETRYRTETDTWTDEDGNSHTDTYQVPYDYYICTVTLENFDLSHVPVYVMGEEQLSRYAIYMATLGNRPDLFPDSPYVNKYITGKPGDYEVPGEYLDDETFAAMLAEAQKYIGYPYVWGGKKIDDGNMQVGAMTAFITYAMMIVMSFLMLTMMSIMLPRAAVAAERIDEVVRTESSIKNIDKPEKLTSHDGVISFEHVNFKYPGAEEDVLHDIDFVAKPGETTAIIGSTGCGKSTLVNLIPRLYDVTDGKILLDGKDIRNISMSDLREEIGFVPQKGVLFSGTIASNLRFGNDNATDEEIKKAAEIAQATEFIEAKDDKYESSISQGGSNVSGGQKQRLAIAPPKNKRNCLQVFSVPAMPSVPALRASAWDYYKPSGLPLY